MSSKPGPDDPVVARDATYYRAPAALRDRVRSSLAAEAGGPWRPNWSWGGMAVAAAMGALLSWNVAMQQVARSEEDRLAAEVETAHVRSLMAQGHLNDVASSDQHTVKPWFQGKLDYAPVVTDLAASAYPLAGGRLEYVNGRAVAALVYRHRLHVINLFEWPSAGESAPELTTRRGYAVVRWKHAGLEYWAISDAAGADVVEFARLFSETRPSAPRSAS